MNVLDSDETISIKIDGLPDATTLVGPTGEVASLDGSFEISGLSSNRAENQKELSNYFKKNLMSDEIIIGMGAGSISQWMRELKFSL